MRDVEQRQPVARPGRPGRRARVAREHRPHALGLAQHERRVQPVPSQIRVEREQRLGVVAAAVARLLHEPAGAVRACDGLRLGAVDEPRPARLAELACDRELRIGELERLAARPRVLHTLLGLAPRALEIDPSCVHHRSPPCRPRSAAAGRGRSEHDAPQMGSRWACGPARGPGCALARSVDATPAPGGPQAAARHSGHRQSS